METIMDNVTTVHTVREVVGVLEDQETLFDTIDGLLSSGFDRAELSMLAGQTTVEEKLGRVFQKVSELEDDPAVPRIAYVSNESIGEAEGGLIGSLLYIGATAATGSVVASGGPISAAIGAAVLAGGSGLMLGTVLAAILDKHHGDYFQQQIDKGGLLLWVRVWDDADERRATDILKRHSAEDVHAHEYQAARPEYGTGEHKTEPNLANTPSPDPVVNGFFHAATNTITYVVHAAGETQAAIIDPVLDFDPKSGRAARYAADEIVNFVQNNNLKVEWILETHVHADHLTAAPYLQERLGGRTAIGEHIREVQTTFAKMFNAEPEFSTDGSQFDHLFTDREQFQIGSLNARVVHTPGHTPACVTYVVGNAAFAGDTIFMPDYGTARADFPGGNAVTLYRSIHRIFELDPGTRLFLCHDYGALGRKDFAWETTVAEQRKDNIHINDSISEAEFVAMRTARDGTLDMPVLLFPSVQVNMRAGGFPPAEGNGVSYLKIPVDEI